MAGVRDYTFPLSDDIEQLIGAGELSAALEQVETHLKKNDRPLMRDRLLFEKQRLKRTAEQFIYTQEEAYQKARDAISGLTEDEFLSCIQSGDALWRLVDGEKRFFVRFLPCVFKMRPELEQRSGKKEEEKSRLKEYAETLKRNGSTRHRIHLSFELSLKENAAYAGFARVHLPLPVRSAQQKNITLYAPQEKAYSVSPENAGSRTACYEGMVGPTTVLRAEYAYTASMAYFSPEKKPSILYPDAEPVSAEDTSELPGHILFTPYLRTLCENIIPDCNTPLQKARAIYDYVTTHIKYSFMPDYILLPNIPEYAARNLKGDCGVQALLFITLCRIAGIPARWQSGLALDERSGGSHDWAQFYLPEWGWLFADCSYGGSAFRRGDSFLHDFYFGNLDPFRLASTSQFQAEFDKPSRFLRNDPYDNQTGEWETENARIPDDQVKTIIRVLECKLIADSSNFDIQ